MLSIAPVHIPALESKFETGGKPKVSSWGNAKPNPAPQNQADTNIKRPAFRQRGKNDLERQKLVNFTRNPEVRYPSAGC